MNETEEYEDEEVETVEEVGSADDWTTVDTILVAGCGISLILVIFTFFYCIKKTFKNMHVKIGNKIDIGIETKE